MEDVEEGQQATVLQYKCSVLNEKLNRLLDIINRDIVNVESGNSQVRLEITNLAAFKNPEFTYICSIVI